MAVPLTNEASLVACKRVLAKLYNEHKDLSMAEKVDILTALGYGNALALVGALFSGMASLSPEGSIDYHVMEAEAQPEEAKYDHSQRG